MQINKGKDNSFYGHHHTEETKRKLSEAKKGKHPSEETRKKLSKLKIGNTNMLGKHLSEETKRKLSEANKGKVSFWKNKTLSKKHKENMSEAHKGKKNSFYGKHHSMETKRKISEIHKGKPLSKLTREKMSGKNNGRWLGGKSLSPYTYDFNKRFKKSIKERDFYCCQLCNVGEEDLLLLKKYLVIHHIDYNKLLSIPQNCITLCNKCNSIVNSNRKQWMLFFQSLLKERYGYQYTQDQKIILDF